MKKYPVMLAESDILLYLVSADSLDLQELQQGIVRSYKKYDEKYNNHPYHT